MENNYGNKIYWRLDRKDKIREVKVKLASTQSSLAASPENEFYFHAEGADFDGHLENPYSEDQKDFKGETIYEKGVRPLSLSQTNMTYNGANSAGCAMAGIVSAEATRLYLVTEYQANDENAAENPYLGKSVVKPAEDRVFEELEDDKTVEYHQIKDGDELYLLTYKWTYKEAKVTVHKTDKILQGVEKEDTVTGIKVKIQDQMGIPANTLTLLRDRVVVAGEYFSADSKPFRHMRDKNKPITAVIKGADGRIPYEEL